MFRVNNKDTRTTPSVFIVNFEHISHLVLVFLLLTLSRLMLAEMSLFGKSIIKVILSANVLVLAYLQIESKANY